VGKTATQMCKYFTLENCGTPLEGQPTAAPVGKKSG